jgi:hypothetical protein
MYALTPGSLEEELRTLDHLRHFALSPPPGPHIADLPYHSFLRDEGYGNALFTTRQDPAEPTEKRFADLAHFWRQYLASSHRLATPDVGGCH